MKKKDLDKDQEERNRKLQKDLNETRDSNRDPISGEPGSHPVGVAAGGTGGAVAGAAIGGAIGGPVGAAIGGVVGAVAGGAAGKLAAEAVNPTEEERYWKENYRNRPYFKEGRDFSHYEPAYRYGWETASRKDYVNRNFEDIESNLESEWPSYRGSSTTEWADARSATRDAFERIRDRSTAEDNQYWHENFRNRPYYKEGQDFDQYEKAYQFGTSCALQPDYANRDFDAIEPEAKKNWTNFRGSVRREWNEIRDAVRDAFNRTRQRTSETFHPEESKLRRTGSEAYTATRNAADYGADKSSSVWDQVKGNWKQFKGAVKEKWNRLTDDEIEAMEGRKERIIGKIQEKYGEAKWKEADIERELRTESERF